MVWPGPVLVDLLLAADDAVVAVGVERDEVARTEPARRVEAAVDPARPVVPLADVRPADEELAVIRATALDAGQGLADRLLAVLAGRGHRDAARRLGHAVAGAELDASPVERLEDHRIEVAGGGEAVAEPAAGDGLEVRRRLLRIVGGGLLHRALVQLDPLLRDADEEGRADVLKSSRSEACEVERAKT